MSKIEEFINEIKEEETGFIDLEFSKENMDIIEYILNDVIKEAKDIDIFRAQTKVNFKNIRINNISQEDGYVKYYFNRDCTIKHRKNKTDLLNIMGVDLFNNTFVIKFCKEFRVSYLESSDNRFSLEFSMNDGNNNEVVVDMFLSKKL